MNTIPIYNLRINTVWCEGSNWFNVNPRKFSFEVKTIFEQKCSMGHINTTVSLQKVQCCRNKSHIWPQQRWTNQLIWNITPKNLIYEELPNFLFHFWRDLLRFFLENYLRWRYFYCLRHAEEILKIGEKLPTLSRILQSVSLFEKYYSNMNISWLVGPDLRWCGKVYRHVLKYFNTEMHLCDVSSRKCNLGR